MNKLWNKNEWTNYTMLRTQPRRQGFSLEGGWGGKSVIWYCGRSTHWLWQISVVDARTHFKRLETFHDFSVDEFPFVSPARRHERLYNIKGEALKLVRTNSSQRTFECKMELASLHDFYGSWYLYICRSLFGYSTFFVDSPLFMKGTSCCVIRRNFKRNWAVGSCYGKVL